MSTNPHSDIRIAPLATLEDFERCVVLQLETWGYSDWDVVPRRIFMVAQHIGGQVIGAFDGDAIVGFAMSLPGFRDGHAYLHSHMLAVLLHIATRAWDNASSSRSATMRLLAALI